jgi:uncharacterized protein
VERIESWTISFFRLSNRRAEWLELRKEFPLENVSSHFKFGGILRENVALIDTSAVIALLDEREALHEKARLFFEECPLDWASLDLTAHETFTRLRARTDVPRGFDGFAFLRTDLTVLDFRREDEVRVKSILEKYADHKISYHDALCAAVMLRSGIYKVFTFDRDFTVLGFQTIPGPYTFG